MSWFKRALVPVVLTGSLIAPPAAQAAVGDTQIAVVDGTSIAHTIRFASGSWQNFGHLPGLSGATAPTSVIIGGEEHLFFHNDTTTLHYIRHTDGTWDLDGGLPPMTGAPTSFAVTALNGRIAFVRQHDNGLQLSIQAANGNWSAWETVPLAFDISGFSVTANGITLRLVVSSRDGLTIADYDRAPDGIWSRANSLGVGAQGLPWVVYSVSAAQVGPDLQVVFAYSFYGLTIQHTILRADGKWDPAGNPQDNGAAGPIPGGGTNGYAVAASQGTLQVVVTTSGGGIYHSIRYADGTWQHWGDVEGAAGHVSPSGAITIAGDNG